MITLFNGWPLWPSVWLQSNVISNGSLPSRRLTHPRVALWESVLPKRSLVSCVCCFGVICQRRLEWGGQNAAQPKSHKKINWDHITAKISRQFGKKSYCNRSAMQNPIITRNVFGKLYTTAMADYNLLLHWCQGTDYCDTLTYILVYCTLRQLSKMQRLI